MAPPTRPATEAARIGASCGVAAATPTAIAATDTMPSLAPSTPARSQFSRFANPPEWGSSACVASSPVTSPSQARRPSICQLCLIASAWLWLRIALGPAYFVLARRRNSVSPGVALLAPLVEAVASAPAWLSTTARDPACPQPTDRCMLDREVCSDSWLFGHTIATEVGRQARHVDR